jgi:hypothetical protein
MGFRSVVFVLILLIDVEFGNGQGPPQKAGTTTARTSFMMSRRARIQSQRLTKDLLKVTSSL